MTVECTDEWNKTYKYIKGEVKNLAFLKGLIKFLVMLIKRQRGERVILISEIFKGKKNWKNKTVLWCLCQSLENINKRTYFLKKKKTRLRETKRRRQYTCATSRGAVTRRRPVGDFWPAGDGQFLDWGYSYTNASLCECLSVSTPIICAVCACILYCNKTSL